MRLAIAALLAAVGLSGCAGMQQAAAEDTAKRAQIEQTRPTCDGQQDCAAKWEAAQLWVIKHAGMKLQTVTTVLIQTFNSADYGLAMTVTKEPLGGGRYTIVAHATGLEPVDAVLAFNADIAAVSSDTP